MFKTEGYPNIRLKAQKLGFSVPNSVWILPKGFETIKETKGILYSADYDTIIKLFRANGIPSSPLNTTFSKLQNNSYELFALPLIAFTYEFLNVSNSEVIRCHQNNDLCTLRHHHKTDY